MFAREFQQIFVRDIKGAEVHAAAVVVIDLVLGQQDNGAENNEFLSVIRQKAARPRPVEPERGCGGAQAASIEERARVMAAPTASALASPSPKPATMRPPFMTTIRSEIASASA